MTNPQQPEIRRSERNPALSPDAMEAKLEARQHELTNALDRQHEHDMTPQDVSPEESDSDEDQPDLDDFAEAFGTKGPSE